MRTDKINGVDYYYPDSEVDAFDGRPLYLEASGLTDFSDGEMLEAGYAIDGKAFTKIKTPVISGKARWYVNFKIDKSTVFNFISGSSRKKMAVRFYTKAGATVTTKYFFVNFIGEQRVSGVSLCEPIPVFWYKEATSADYPNDVMNAQKRNSLSNSASANLKSFDGSLWASRLYSLNEAFSGVASSTAIAFTSPLFECVKICPENMVQLLWGEYGYDTVLAFWFHIKETIYDSEEVGIHFEQRGMKKVNNTAIQRDMATVEIPISMPKRQLVLTTGKFSRKIINRVAKLAESPIVFTHVPPSKQRHEHPAEWGNYDVAHIERESLSVIHHETDLAEIELIMNVPFAKPDYLIL